MKLSTLIHPAVELLGVKRLGAKRVELLPQLLAIEAIQIVGDFLHLGSLATAATLTLRQRSDSVEPL